jgi:hypothetical protein
MIFRLCRDQFAGSCLELLCRLIKTASLQTAVLACTEPQPVFQQLQDPGRYCKSKRRSTRPTTIPAVAGILPCLTHRYRVGSRFLVITLLISFPILQSLIGKDLSLSFATILHRVACQSNASEIECHIFCSVIYQYERRSAMRPDPRCKSDSVKRGFPLADGGLFKAMYVCNSTNRHRLSALILP